MKDWIDSQGRSFDFKTSRTPAHAGLASIQLAAYSLVESSDEDDTDTTQPER